MKESCGFLFFHGFVVEAPGYGISVLRFDMNLLKQTEGRSVNRKINRHIIFYRLSG